MLSRSLAIRRSPLKGRRWLNAPGREALRRELDVRPLGGNSSTSSVAQKHRAPLALKPVAEPGFGRGVPRSRDDSAILVSTPPTSTAEKPSKRESTSAPRNLGRLDLTQSTKQRPVMDLTSMLLEKSEPPPGPSTSAAKPAPITPAAERNGPQGFVKDRLVASTSTPAPLSTVTFPPGTDTISVKALAELSTVSVERLVGQVVQLGAADESLLPARVLEQVRGGRLTSRHAMSRAAATIELPVDTAELILLECGVQVQYGGEDKQDRVRQVATKDTPRRAPIVVVMGHVDHGKTTLLDALRNTNVAAKEEGGITQSIAAFRVDLPGGLSACFLDTPGHEAFSSMRKSGTLVTDVACVVVAATDGAMPQTVESITFARAAKLPIVYAITKCDMAKARASKELTDEAIEAQVTDQLNVLGLLDSDRDMFVRVVAPERRGLDELIEAIRMQVELNEESLLARSDLKGPGEAVVLESKIDRALGPVADVVVRWGTLRVGDYVVCEEKWAKVRRLELNDGRSVAECPPATPARMSGFDSSLSPGSDILVVSQGERECKRIVEFRERRKQRQADRDAKRKAIRLALSGKAGGGTVADERRTGRKTLGEKKMQRKLQQEKMEEVLSQMEERHGRCTRVILRADSEGSLNALLFAVNQMKEKGQVPEDREVVIVKSAVGTFTEQDLELAQTTESYLLGFNIRFPGTLAKKAKALNILGVHTHGVIYNLLEEFSLQVQEQVKKQEELLGEIGTDGANTQRSKVKGVAQVLGVFDLKGKDKKQVAGIRVLEGALNKNDVYVVKRNGEVIAQLKAVDSLRILKKDVAIVEKGGECGLALQDFVGYEVGDTIEAFDAPAR